MMTEQVSPLTDPMVVRINRETLREAAARAIFCPVSGRVMDMRRTIILTATREGATVARVALDASAWVEREASVRAGLVAKFPGVELAVLDGREWYATDAQRSALAVVDAHGSAALARRTDNAEATVSRAVATALLGVGLLVDFTEDGTTYVHRPVRQVDENTHCGALVDHQPHDACAGGAASLRVEGNNSTNQEN